MYLVGLLEDVFKLIIFSGKEVGEILLFDECIKVVMFIGFM